MTTPNAGKQATQMDNNQQTTRVLRGNSGQNGGNNKPPAARITEASKVELLRASQATIKDKATARKWLCDRELLVKGEVITTSTLSAALLYVASGSIVEYGMLLDAIRAVAICLDNIQMEGTLKEAVDGLMAKAAEDIERANVEVRQAATEMMETVTESMAEMEKRVKEERERMEKERKVVESEGRTARQDYFGGYGGGTGMGAGRSWGDEMQDLEDGEVERNREEHRNVPMSYARVIAKNAYSLTEGRRNVSGKSLSREEQRIQAEVETRVRRRDHQVLVDDAFVKADGSGRMEPHEIVEKANKAWGGIKLEDLDCMEEEEFEAGSQEGKFITAKVLKNGGVILEMDNSAVVSYFRWATVRKAFERELGGEAKVKERVHTVLVEFIPVRLQHTLQTEEMKRRIEVDNNLGCEAIERIRWMRNPELTWSKTQAYAHAIITTKCRYTANDIISSSVIIEGQRHKARKLEDDPRRCYKCQDVNVGHAAAACTRSQVCANCSKADHTTGECTMAREDYACASCKLAGRRSDHASWSRKCPVFLEQQQKLRDRYPENHFRFYPVNGMDWTWEFKEKSMMDGNYREREWFNDDEQRHGAIQDRWRQDNGYKQWPVDVGRRGEPGGGGDWGVSAVREEGEREQGLPRTQKSIEAREKENTQATAVERTRVGSRKGQTTLTQWATPSAKVMAVRTASQGETERNGQNAGTSDTLC